MIISPLPTIPSPTFNPPTPSLISLQGSMNVITTPLSHNGSGCIDIFRCRTTTNIVLSCLTTILACTWVAFHPDALGYESMWKSFWWRFKGMIVALITPEFITAWAISDRLKAKEYMDRWNENFVPLCSPEHIAIRGKTTQQYERELKKKNYNSRWSLTHGFLAAMNGIEIYDGNDKHKIFKPKPKFFQSPKMRPIIQQIGLISAQDIEDKSKGDWMSRSFVVIQTTWFVVQCLARWASHLPVAELEVVTLAYAVLDITIYSLWWNKPQTLTVPFLLYLEKDDEICESLVAEGDGKEKDGSLMGRSPSPTIVDEKPTSNEWVGTTYSGAQGFFVYESVSVMFGLLAGSIFGALHLIPIWLSEFPSNAEKILWRVSAFYVTGTPVALLVMMFVSITVLESRRFDRSVREKIASVFFLCAAAAYIVARIVLLVLSLTTLRSLPKEAFRSVEWTRFIPHF